MTGQSSIAGTASMPAAFQKLSAAAITYAENDRRISRATLDRLGAGSATVFFPELQRESEGVLFPYRSAAEVVN